MTGPRITTKPVRRRWLASLLPAALLAGCAAGPDYTAPSLPGGPAPRLREADLAAVTPSPLPAQWWQLFDDAELNRLVARALERNTDLRQASANLQRARALLSEARAGQLPTTGVNAQYVRQRFGGQVFNAVGGFPVLTTDFYSTTFDSSYEIDLFGGVSRAVEAARADAGAAQAQVDAARVTVAAETARAYVLACAYAVQADVARETVRLQDQSFDLTRRLVEGGRSTRRDLAQAEALKAQTEAELPRLEAERRAALYALAYLTGDAPEAADMAAAQCRTLPRIARPIPVGDGQALIARRPDVRAAERTLAGDTARIGVATAALYPSISLGGQALLGSPQIGDLGRSASFGYSLGPLISWSFPLNGAGRARVRQARAGAEASLAAFDGTVLKALQEAEQALARLGGALDREAALARANAATAEAARLSELRYRAGADSFLQLLDAERQRATARAALAQAEADRAEAQIALFKALGGGWEAPAKP